MDTADAEEDYQKFDGFWAKEQEGVIPDKLCSGAKKCSPQKK
jgi:hypothetical protein